MLQEAIEAALDVNTHLIAELGGEVPEEYYGGFLKVGQPGVLPADLAVCSQHRPRCGTGWSTSTRRSTMRRCLRQSGCSCSSTLATSRPSSLIIRRPFYEPTLRELLKRFEPSINASSVIFIERKASGAVRFRRTRFRAQQHGS